MRRLHIFDIDGTIACSKHRQATKPDGSLDLDHWRENSTPEKVAQDEELPLAALMREVKKAGDRVAICTARVMSAPDWEWLALNDLAFDYAMFRIEGDTRADHDMKQDKIADLLKKLRVSPAQYESIILYDDNKSVLTMAESLGLTAICAKSVNFLVQKMGVI